MIRTIEYTSMVGSLITLTSNCNECRERYPSSLCETTLTRLLLFLSEISSTAVRL